MSGTGDETGFDSQVAARLRLAQEDVAGTGFLRSDAQRRSYGVLGLAAQQARAARAAVPGLAAVRQVEAGRQRRVEQRLRGRHAQNARLRLDAYQIVVLAQRSKDHRECGLRQRLD